MTEESTPAPVPQPARRRPLDWGTVRAFRDALIVAVADTAAEAEGEDLLFFFDTDVILSAMIGMTLPSGRDVNTRDPTIIVLALMSGGYLPPARMLVPHQVEFERKIVEYRSRSLMPRVTVGYAEHLKRRWRLIEFEEEFKKIAQGSDPAADFMKLLEAQGGDLFVKVVLCLGGYWTERLERLWSTGRLSLDGPHLPRGPRALQRDLVTLFNRYRAAADHAKNNFTDAGALASLFHSMESPEWAARVRFFSLAPTVERVLGDAVVSRQLQRLGLTTSSFVRGPYYFLVRSSFEALAFKHLRTEGVEGQDFDPGELTALCRELSDLLGQKSPGGPAEVLKNLRVGSWQVDELLENVLDLELARSCLFTRKTTSALKAWLPELYSIYDSPLGRKVSTAFDTRFDELRSQFIEEIEGWRTWQDYLRPLLKGADLKGASGEDRVPDIGSDVGLTRWELHRRLTTDGRARLEEWLQQIHSSDKQRRMLAVAEIAFEIASKPKSLADLEAVVCVLWYLQDLTSLTLVWSSASRPPDGKLGLDPWFGSPEEREASSWPGLEALALVARTKLQSKSQNDSIKLLRSVQALLPDLDTCVGLGAVPRLMGAAHAAYWGWDMAVRREVKLSVLPNRDEEVRQIGEHRRALAEYSWDAGRRALSLVEDAETMDFCINHLTYVGAAEGVHSAETQRYYEALHATHRDDAHYRFADTLAKYHSAPAIRVARQVGTDEVCARKDEFEWICRSLWTAWGLLPEPEDTFHDADVEKHRGEVRDYLGWCGCHALNEVSAELNDDETPPGTG